MLEFSGSSSVFADFLQVFLSVNEKQSLTIDLVSKLKDFGYFLARIFISIFHLKLFDC